MGRLRHYTQAPYDDGMGQQMRDCIDWLVSTVNTLVQQNIQGSGLTALANPQINPTTPQLLSRGNRVQSVTTAFKFTTTTGSVSFFWDGTNGSTPLSIYRDDNTLVSPIVGNQTVTGLSASTTYFFYPFYDEASGAVKWAAVAGAVGSPPIAYTSQNILAAQQQLLQGHIALAVGLATSGVTTPASGTGSGSGGGGGGGGNGGGGRYLQ